MTIGYNTAAELANLFEVKEAYVNDEIGGMLQEIGDLTKQMNDIKEFLAFVREKTEESQRLDLSAPEDFALLEKLRQYPSLEAILPVGIENRLNTAERIENLNQVLQDHIRGPIKGGIDRLFQKVALKNTEILEIFAAARKTVQDSLELARIILMNIERAR